MESAHWTDEQVALYYDLLFLHDDMLHTITEQGMRLAYWQEPMVGYRCLLTPNTLSWAYMPITDWLAMKQRLHMMFQKEFPDLPGWDETDEVKELRRLGVPYRDLPGVWQNPRYAGQQPTKGLSATYTDEV